MGRMRRYRLNLSPAQRGGWANETWLEHSNFCHCCKSVSIHAQPSVTGETAPQRRGVPPSCFDPHAQRGGWAKRYPRPRSANWNAPARQCSIHAQRGGADETNPPPIRAAPLSEFSIHAHRCLRANPAELTCRWTIRTLVSIHAQRGGGRNAGLPWSGRLVLVFSIPRPRWLGRNR